MPKSINPKSTLIAIVILAVALRVAAAFYLGQDVAPLPGTFDQVSYHNLAVRVLDGHGFSFGEQWWPATPAGEPTAHWSFLYTLYLSAVYSIFGVNPLVARLIQAVAVGILLPWLTYRLARQLFDQAPGDSRGSFDRDRREIIALLAAGIAGIYIYFVYYAAALMTESFYFVGIMWILSLTISLSRRPDGPLRTWLLLGVALALTVLLRQVFLLFIPFLLLWLWWAGRPGLIRLGVPLVVLAVFILPWSVRNTLAFDQFVLLNTNSGFAFYWGNHPIYGTQFVPILPDGTYYDLLPQDLLHLNEAALNDAVMELAVAEITADPGRYVLLSLSRIPPYFKFWPSADSSILSNISRVGSFALFLPFMVIGLGRTLTYRYRSLAERLASPLTLIYLFGLVYGGVHVLTWTLIRYRLPLDALLIIFAGLGIVTVAQRFFDPGRQALVSTRQSSSA